MPGKGGLDHVQGLLVLQAIVAEERRLCRHAGHFSKTMVDWIQLAVSIRIRRARPPPWGCSHC